MYIARCVITTLLIIFICPTFAWASETFRIEVIGIQGDMLRNVEARLKLEEKESDVDASSPSMKPFLKKVPKIIRKALEPYGYFSVNVAPAGMKFVDSQMIASFHVNPGPPLTITSIKVELLGNGKTNSALNKIIQNFQIKTGMVFKSDDYENAKDILFQTASDQGYIKSYFVKNEVRIDLKHYRADVVLILQTFNKYYFGNLIYDKSNFKQTFLDRFQFFKQESHFSSKKLYKFQQNMSNSGYFQQVDATPDFDHIENYHVPVRIALTAPKSQRYSFGIGYGTFTGPRLSAGVNLRRITDTGQHMNAELKISSVLTGFAAKYYIPGNNPLTEQYVIGTSYQRFLPKNGRSFSKNVSGGYIKKSGPWNNSLTLNYLSELYSIKNSIENKKLKNGELFYPSLNLSYIKADDLINPHRGLSLNLILQGASKNILSSTNFLQSEIKGKYIFSPLENGRVVLRGDLGYTLIKDMNNLPLTLHYFAGGLTSIRGYPDSSIGPGKYLIVGSGEYQHRIWQNWFGAVFYDTGTVSNNYGKSPFSVGDGIGIIYQSAIGPIKLYVSRAETKRDKPFSLEFNVGPEF